LIEKEVQLNAHEIASIVVRTASNSMRNGQMRAFLWRSVVLRAGSITSGDHSKPNRLVAQHAVEVRPSAFDKTQSVDERLEQEE